MKLPRLPGGLYRSEGTLPAPRISRTRSMAGKRAPNPAAGMRNVLQPGMGPRKGARNIVADMRRGKA